MNRFQVRLFGAFRDFSNESTLALELPEGATVAHARVALSEIFGQSPSGLHFKALLNDSVLADERTTLLESDPISAGAELAILPPVCGG